MGKVVFDISMSLDGYVAGPDDGPELGLGVGGERLHEWVVELASWREPHGLEGGETNASSAGRGGHGRLWRGHRGEADVRQRPWLGR